MSISVPATIRPSGGIGRKFLAGVFAAAAIAGAASHTQSGTNQGTAGEAPAGSGIPAVYVPMYKAAANAYHVNWYLLASIHDQETSFSTSRAVGVQQGANSVGAMGPMQFLQSTWNQYASAFEPIASQRPASYPQMRTPHPDVYDDFDAIAAAAKKLSNDGADESLTSQGTFQAVCDYIGSCANVQQCGGPNSYCDVLPRAQQWQAEGGAAVASASGAAERAVSFALAQQGTPYVWGGDGNGGFDCSGLVQAAYASAGITLPRVAQAQFDAGPPVPAGEPLEPGDLVFFGAMPTSVEHVGIVVGPGTMVDAPFTGAVVRTDQFPTAVGAQWGSQVYLGATRPSASTTATPA
jgi:cell wall-associated NlpC family hydrolase